MSRSFDQWGNVALGHFVGGERWVSCTLLRVDGQWSVSGSGRGMIYSKGPSEGTAVFAGEFWNDWIHLVDVHGWVPPRARSVEIVRTDGEVIEGVVNKGFVLAWWPVPVQPR